jgi:hypothetical protein
MAEPNRRFPPRRPGRGGRAAVALSADGRKVGFAVDAGDGWIIRGTCEVIQQSLVVTSASVEQAPVPATPSMRWPAVAFFETLLLGGSPATSGVGSAWPRSRRRCSTRSAV